MTISRSIAVMALSLTLVCEAQANNSTSTSQITVNGSVPAACSFSSITVVGDDFTINNNNVSITIQDFADPVTLQHSTTQFTVTYGNAICNWGQAYLGLKSANGALTTAGSIRGNFLNHVSYTAEAHWDGIVNSFSATNGTGPVSGINNANAIGPRRGNIVLQATTENTPSNKSLIGGNYQDIITMQIGNVL